MKEYFSMKPKKRKKVVKRIKKTLQQQKEIIFSYLFGSFLDNLTFRDIDVGVYLKEINKEEVFDYELKLAERISNNCDVPFDIIEVKVFNFAPNPFLNSVFREGKLLFSRDNKLLTDMIEKSSLESIANEYIAKQSLKELVPD